MDNFHVKYKEGDFEIDITLPNRENIIKWLDYLFAQREVAKENIRLEKEIQDLLSGATIPPELQEKLNQVFAASKANIDKISKAIADNQIS